jgi:hypothetical protein
MLYFLHQVIAYTVLGDSWLGAHALHLNFHQWWKFWALNAVLILACIGLGYAWQAIKPRSNGWFVTARAALTRR